MRVTQGERLLIQMLHLLVAGIVVVQAFGYSSMASALFTMSFIPVLLLWCSVAARQIKGTDVLVLGIAVIALINILINAYEFKAVVSFSYLKKYIMFMTSLLYLQSVSKIRIDRRLADYLLNLVSLLVIFLVIAFVWLGSQMYVLNGQVTNYLTFRFTNPNLTALFISCMSIIELYRALSEEGKARRALHLVLFALTVYFIVETQSRNALIVIAAYTVGCAYLRFSGRDGFSFGQVASTIVSVFPIVFVWLYLAVYNNDVITSLFSFLIGEGKDLDSRALIWKGALANYAESPIVGAYYQISGGSGTSQLHNTHLDVLVSYGPIVLVLTCVMIYSFIRQKAALCDIKASSVLLLGFSCTILLGMGEAALFSGGLSIFCFLGLPLLLAGSFGEVEEVAVA